MNPAELIFGSLLVVALLALAGYFAWRQKKTLEKLRKQDLSPEDRLYAYKQVQRRLLCCVLMAVLGGMLIGGFFLGNQLRSEGEAVAKKADDRAPDDAERRDSVRLFTFYWITFLLLLLVVLMLAAVDLLAIARFGFRHQRQLEAERRAMLESQAMRLRQERNGHH
jgi:flagellar basal body-associated protein FliL